MANVDGIAFTAGWDEFLPYDMTTQVNLIWPSIDVAAEDQDDAGVSATPEVPSVGQLWPRGAG